MVMLMETPASTFYLNLNAENNNTYIASNGIAETATQVADSVLRLADGRGEIHLERQSLPGGATLQRTTLVNTGDTALLADTLSAAFLTGIGSDGERRWDDDRFRVHFAYSSWQGEGQWRHMSPEDAGLYKTYNHHSQTSVRLRSVGTWSTAKYYPLLLLEDTELHRTHFFEVLVGGTGWQIELCARGHREDSTLCVFLGAACEGNDGWTLTLAPGERYTTCPALYGCVEGGFEEAVAALTGAKRALALRRLPGGVPPLCFNDYMNCLWALPTREKLIPLMDAAARVGAEYFVIDAGWFRTSGNWSADMGDWEPWDELFGEGGVQGILDEIVARGMKPGVWLEIESVGISSAFAKAHPEALLYRHGHVIGKDRCFMDFRNPAVRAHIRGVFDRLYRMGVRYVKNDYNQSVGVGIDTPGAPDRNGALALGDHAAAVLSLVDEICTAYPDFIIESCCSGAMRSDFGAVRHFYLQSSSDQEDYLRTPSVITGLSACLPPERVGVWACPYPVAIDYRDSFRSSAEFTAGFADGRVTVHNMVSGLMGLMYLSGHIDCADEFNLSLMRQAADIYKRNRTIMARAVPVFPAGTLRLSGRETFPYGLLDREGGKLLLAVWSTALPDGTPLQTQIDLSRYAGAWRVADVYPALPGYTASVSGATLTVTLPERGSAAYIELDIL